jgi:hypothetical protein
MEVLKITGGIANMVAFYPVTMDKSTFQCTIKVTLSL